MFGSGMLIINQKSDDNTDVIDDYVSNEYLNMMINQYILALGEYDQIDNYNFSVLGSLTWTFFIFASFASTVLVLNMIIAIMSDTYGRVTQSYILHTRTMKLWIMIDYIRLLRILEKKFHLGKDDNDSKDEFLIIVTKKSDDLVEEQEWEGTVNAVRHSIKHHSENLEEKFNKRIE